MKQHLLNLMQRGKLKWSWNIEPEQRLSIECADAMRAATLEGRYRGIWTHVANEGKRSRIVAQILKAMGMIPGAPDMWHIWQAEGKCDAGLIEFKAGKNKASPAQKDYLSWADDNNIKTAIARSKQEYLDTLVEWGALKDIQRLPDGYAWDYKPQVNCCEELNEKEKLA